MIDIKTKIHDKFSIEFKLGLITRRKLKSNDFSVGMWICLPGSLDINSSTYSKENFYRDVKSKIRLITPRFLLREIVSGEAIPLSNVRKAAALVASVPTRTSLADYEYQTKLFAAIVKSSLRDEVDHILESGNPDDTLSLYQACIKNVEAIIRKFESVRSIVDTPTAGAEALKIFNCCAEFICNTSSQQSFRLLKHLDTLKDTHFDAAREDLTALIRDIESYCAKRGYATLSRTDDKRNASYIFRHGMIKKYVESQLYLNVPKKRDGVIAEQALYSVAAGLAMIFATVVAWAFQKTFGNLTWPLFIALVISYMMKDRIKELMRYYFAHKAGNRYFDKKAKICLKDNQIGWMKEAMDFVDVSKLPSEVKDLRSRQATGDVEESVYDETVIYYRTQMHIDRDKLESGSTYDLAGLNDIIRLQVNSFLQKMDNPKHHITLLDNDGSTETVLCDRYYYINIVLRYTHAEETGYKHFRVCLARDGIREIVQVV